MSIPEGPCVDSFDGGPRRLHETACLLTQDGRPFVRPRLLVALLRQTSVYSV